MTIRSPEGSPKAGSQTSWLCRTPLARERLLEMERASRPALICGFVVTLIAFLVLLPKTGWITLALFAAAGTGYGVVSLLATRVARPEYWMLAADLNGTTLTAACVALYGGAHSAFLPLFLLPLVSYPSRHGLRGSVIGGAFTIIAIATATSLGGPPLTTEPSLGVMTLAVAAGVVMYTLTMMRAELGHRAHALVDPLTGTLNRRGLDARFEELRQQAVRDDASVALVLCDIDHFKRVNDSRGHHVGDLVLAETAQALRMPLRAFESVYRLGGEEFLLVVPGVTLNEAAAIAERIRAAIGQARPGGVELTVSLGVSAASGEAIEFDRLLAQADEALYEAKRRGRDRVVAAPARAPALTAPGGRRAEPLLLAGRGA